VYSYVIPLIVPQLIYTSKQQKTYICMYSSKKSYVCVLNQINQFYKQILSTPPSLSLSLSLPLPRVEFSYVWWIKTLILSSLSIPHYFSRSNISKTQRQNTKHRFILGNPHGEENPANFSLYSIVQWKAFTRRKTETKCSLVKPQCQDENRNLNARNQKSHTNNERWVRVNHRGASPLFIQDHNDISPFHLIT